MTPEGGTALVENDGLSQGESSMAVQPTGKQGNCGAANPNYKGYMHRKCRQCEGPINGSSVTKKYCSVACYAAAQRVYDYNKVCTWCGKDFLHRVAKHCSATCAKAHRDATLSESGRRKREAKFRKDNNIPTPPRPTLPKVLRTCAICGKGMLVSPSQERQGKKYCSRECYAKSVSVRQTGEGHHNYKHGQSLEKFSARQAIRRHPQYKKWVKAVLARDSYKCRSCNTTNDELHVHHHVAWVADPKLRLKVGNGITLCKECHRLWHVYDRRGVFGKKESLLQEKIITVLRDYGFYVFNVPGNPLGTHGVPDLLVTYKGIFGGIECKVFPNYLSELQKVHGAKITEAGGIFHVAYSEDDIGRIIEKFESKAIQGSMVNDE